MATLGNIESGADILTVMQSGVVANQGFIDRWKEFEAVNAMPLVDQSFGHSEALAISGLPIDKVYAGLENLTDSEVLSLQARLAQEVLEPRVEEHLGGLSVDVIEAVKTQLLAAREQYWAELYAHTLDGLAVEIRPAKEDKLAQFKTVGPSGSRTRRGHLSSGYLRGIMTGLSIAKEGSIMLEQGYRFYSGAKPEFDEAEVDHIFSPVPGGAQHNMVPLVEISLIPPRKPDSDPANSAAVALPKAA